MEELFDESDQAGIIWHLRLPEGWYNDSLFSNPADLKCSFFIPTGNKVNAIVGPQIPNPKRFDDMFGKST